MTLTINKNTKLFTENDYATTNFPNKVDDGLLFIPDISGFTHFVENTDIQLGSRITADLLSALIECNQLGLTVSEIEGDAVLFYRYGPAPAIRDVMEQAQLMLEVFQSRINGWAILSQQARELSLKLIVHYGPIASIAVGGIYNKLYGKTVLEAHHLLKNNIDASSYLLMTESFLNATTSTLEVGCVEKLQASNQIWQTDDALGKICYTYLPL